MSDDTQAGCMSLRSLFGIRRSTGISHNRVETMTHPDSGAHGARGVCAEEKGELPHGEPGKHTFASCCDFVTSNVDGDNIWLRDTDAPPAYQSSTAGTIYRPEVLKTIEETLDGLNGSLRELSLDIHSHPEIMFQEKYAHDTLTKYMEDHGFEITRHYKDMSTAWRAAFVNKPESASAEALRTARTLGVNSEMDALPQIGHACGHNLIAIAGVGVAIAVKVALEKHEVPGTVVLLGTPAEEGGQGKATLITRGAYKEMHACVMSHPGPGPAHAAALGPSLAFQGVEVEFFGQTAHASAAPWEGVNALDAAFLAYNGVSVLRQQMKPDHRVHGVIKGPGDLAANVIPDYTKMLWYVRAPSKTELDAFRGRVIACFKAAATATGCKYKVTVDQAALDLRQNDVLAQEFADIMQNRYGSKTTLSGGAIGGSTDFGNVTYELPAIHPAYSIPTVPNGGNHTPGFTAAAKTPEAHAATIVVTKALALTGFRILDDADYYAKAKKAYDDGKTFYC